MITESELAVLVRLCYTNAEIADQLCLSVCTVKTHLYTLMKKLGARSRTAALFLALEAQIIKTSDVIL